MLDVVVQLLVAGEPLDVWPRCIHGVVHPVFCLRHSCRPFLGYRGKYLPAGRGGKLQHPGPRDAASITSSIESAGTKFIDLRTSRGRSSRSPSFSFGRTTVVTPARCA